LRMPSGEDKSRLSSMVFPSLRFSSSTSLTTPHFTQKRPAAHYRPDGHCHRWDQGYSNGAAVSDLDRRKRDFAAFLCRRALNVRSRSPRPWSPRIPVRNSLGSAQLACLGHQPQVKPVGNLRPSALPKTDRGISHVIENMGQQWR
jgi:hypothetical protein